MVEVLVAVTILVVAALGAVGTLAQVTRLGEANRESTVAYQAARSVVERVQSLPFEEVFLRFNDDPNDDPLGPGTAEGMHFQVAGLSPRADDADGFAGRVLLPASAGSTLLETLNDDRFGMPRDLNGDGAIDGVDHVEDHILLPLRVQVQWSGASGARTAEFATTLGRRR